jgi:hypothetical protein
VQNPLRSEAAAFQLVIASLVYFGVIVVAALIATWLGVVVFVAATAIAVWLLRGGSRPEPEQRHVEHEGSGDERRILVVANETVAGAELHALVKRRSEGYREEVLVVCPALNSRVRTWASDEDSARADAQARLDASLAALGNDDINARGVVADGDPVQAVEDAMATFTPDEIVVSTHPEGRSNWLERGVVAAIEARYDVPVWHVVVDLER